MSGIVGILHRNGAPVERKLLDKMTGFLEFRGPDAQETWIDGNIGFGHTLLRTTWEAEREKQPCSLDGRVWITADARIDRREELIDQLRAAGRHPSKEVTDPELILHAYFAWNERCLDRLLGDFSFAIWDGRTRRLFCARDHFGIKLFYYSQAGGNFLFSNTLKCIRLSPDVSGELNDKAIVDFLLSDGNQDLETTTFSDIQRLPGGHYLICTETQFEVHPYWSLPVDGLLSYRRAEDYVEHFRDLLRTAVRDRLRTDHIGVFMSGGLDSSGLAATARDLLAKQSSSYDLRAYTIVYDSILDKERHFAELVADALKIPIHFLPGDRCGLYEGWGQPELLTPEPVHSPLSAIAYDQFAAASAHCRVVFYGEGPDNAMYYEWQPYVLHLLKTFQWGRLVRDLFWHARYHRGIPLVRGLGNRLSRWRTGKTTEPWQPKWIRPEMLKLATQNVVKQRTVHPFHPVAHRWMTGPTWESIFEGYDAGSTLFPVEVRYPYMDVRIIRYLLSIPLIPWCRGKLLMRRALAGAVPSAVLERPKSPLLADPIVDCFETLGLPQWVPEPALSRYVDPEVVKSELEKNVSAVWDALRPVSLNFFLAFNKWNVRE